MIAYFFSSEIQVVDMKFHIKSRKVSWETSDVDVSFMTHINKTDREQTGETSIAQAEEVTNTFQWHWKNATSVSGSADFKTGIPFIAEGKIKIGLENTYWIGKSNTYSTSHTKSLTHQASVVAGRRTKTTAKIIVKKHNLHVPFTATFKGGKKEKGMFKSVWYEVMQETSDVAL